MILASFKKRIYLWSESIYHDGTNLYLGSNVNRQEISDHLLAQEQLKMKILDIEGVIEHGKMEKERINHYHLDCEQGLKKDIESLQVRPSNGALE